MSQIVRKNLIPNPSFELAEADWPASFRLYAEHYWSAGTPTVTKGRSTAQAASGSACYAFTNANAAPNAADLFVLGTEDESFPGSVGYLPLPIKVGMAHTFSVKLRSTHAFDGYVSFGTARRHPTIPYSYIDLSDGDTGVVAVPANTWQTFSVTLTPILGADLIMLWMECAPSGSEFAAGQSFYVDCLMLEQAESADSYFDGDTT